MIDKIDAFIGLCDNCKDIFDSGEYSVFVDWHTIAEKMDDSGWFVGHINDTKFAGKHYCPSCFKYDEENEDDIIVDESRKNLHEKQAS